MHYPEKTVQNVSALSANLEPNLDGWFWMYVFFVY